MRVISVLSRETEALSGENKSNSACDNCVVSTYDEASRIANEASDFSACWNRVQCHVVWVHVVGTSS